MESGKKQQVPVGLKIEPQATFGKITLAGESVSIDPTSVTSSKGGTADEVVKGLEKLSKKRVFSEPPNEENSW